MGKRFGKEPFLFRHLQLVFPAKGFLVITGASGSGKSTLLSLLSGFDSPSEGTVYFQGKNLAKLSKKERAIFHACYTSFLFQHYELLEEMTSFDNVMLPLLMMGKKKKEAKSLALQALEEEGLREKAGTKVRLLSGGEKQRVGLARAFVTEPKVIFADEPTGALDSKNATRVMERLKKESAMRLVIMVSHNLPLSEAYADAILHLEDGDIFWAKEARTPTSVPSLSWKKKSGGNWQGRILRRHFYQDGKKNALCLFAGLFGMVAILLCLGFSFGSRPALQEASSVSLGYPFAALTKKEEIEVAGSPLKLVKEIRPSLEEGEGLLEGHPGLSLEKDYRYFLPETNAFTHKGKEEEPCLFMPVFDSSLSEWGSTLLEKGETGIPDRLDLVYCNEAFEEAYFGVGKTIDVPLSFSIVGKGKKDDFSFSLPFSIVGEAREFSFMSQPTIYYSYPALEGFLRNLTLENVEKGKPLLSYLEENGIEDYFGEALFVFAHSPRAAEDLFALEKQISEADSLFSLTSNAYEASASFLLLCDAFDAALRLFIGIAFAGFVLILGIAGLSCYFAHRKENAILLALGAEKEEVISLQLEESLLLCLFSGIASLFAAPFIALPVNKLFSGYFGIANLVRIPLSSFYGLPYFFPVLFLLGAILVGLFSPLIPILFTSKKPLMEELRDE